MQQRRTKTYIAGDWDNDKEAIDKLYEWKKNGRLSIDFHDAHEYTQARDSSLCCSIKKSLHERLNISHTFVLVVGAKTDSLTKGSCQYCSSYDSYNKYCHRPHSIDYRSYIQYECDYAVEHNLRVIILYYCLEVYLFLCPENLRNQSFYTHVPMLYKDQYGQCFWNYNAIKNAFMFE